MAASSHPDYHVITKELARLHDKSGTSKATQLSINVIRNDVAAPAGRKTNLGRGKVFVIEEAELMTSAAQNALLKTLEEPYGRTVIILLTNRAGDLLPTIRSRCQIISFVPLAEEQILAELKRRKIDGKLASAAARLADGSLGLALRHVENEVIEAAEQIVQSIDELVAGKAKAGFADLLKQSAEQQAQKTLERDELASKDAAMRGGLNLFFAMAARRLREHLLQIQEPANLEKACRAIDALARAEKYIDANVNVSLVLEQLGLTLATGAAVV
jgi:DNA polymerase-3 subunit delta'